MPIVTWRDEYSVNVEKIDLQHQKLIELVNNLHASVEARVSKNELEELLIELVKFTRVHFSTEEKYMKDYDFPESEEIRQWLESSDWDETLSLVYVYSSRKIVEEYEQLQQDDLGQLIRNDETKTMSIVRIIIRRGFKVMALAELV